MLKIGFGGALLLLTQMSLSIALGDTVFVNVITSQTPLKFVQTINNSTTITRESANFHYQFTVNAQTHRVYKIIWNTKQAENIDSIVGDNYSAELHQARKKPILRVPLRGIIIDDGDLSVSQFGSMVSGYHGIATINSLAP